MPAHGHNLQGTDNAAGDGSPVGNVPATGAGSFLYDNAGTNLVTMDADMVTGGPNGTSPHNNLMPFLCVNFIIALFGIYPSRN